MSRVIDIDLAADCLVEEDLSLDSKWLPWVGSPAMPPPAEGWNDDEVSGAAQCDRLLDDGSKGGYTACSRAPHEDEYHVSHGLNLATAWVRREVRHA